MSVFIFLSEAEVRSGGFLSPLFESRELASTTAPHESVLEQRSSPPTALYPATITYRERRPCDFLIVLCHNSY